MTVFVGELSATADRSRTITNNKIVTGHGQTGVIEGIALTRFHVLTLHSNCIAATCLLNNQLVFLDEFDKRDPVCGLVQDSYRTNVEHLAINYNINEIYQSLSKISSNPFKSPTEASPWIFSLRSVFTYRIKSEGRSVWRIYLELKDYEEAKKHCNDDERVRAEILSAQAENLLSQAIKNPTANGFRETARIFAKSDALLSEVALKLLPTADAGVEENRFRNEAIIFFLKHRKGLQ